VACDNKDDDNDDDDDEEKDDDDDNNNNFCGIKQYTQTEKLQQIGQT
jgi:hypothetical protein